MSNPAPSGAEMIERSRRIYDYVKEVLREVPQTRGDYMLLYFTVLRKYYAGLVTVKTRPTIIIKYRDYRAFFMCPSAETVRRRCQEIQHDERERIWKMVAEKYPQYANLEDFRERPECIEEFIKLSENSEYLPSGRVIRKRKRNEIAHVHEFGIGQLFIEDEYMTLSKWAEPPSHMR